MPSFRTYCHAMFRSLWKIRSPSLNWRHRYVPVIRAVRVPVVNDSHDNTTASENLVSIISTQRLYSHMMYCSRDPLSISSWDLVSMSVVRVINCFTICAHDAVFFRLLIINCRGIHVIDTLPECLCAEFVIKKYESRPQICLPGG